MKTSKESELSHIPARIEALKQYEKTVTERTEQRITELRELETSLKQELECK